MNAIHPYPMRQVDVVVVGGGPAGAAAALTLLRGGASVLVVDRSIDRAVVGEGLPPGAAPVLRDLGLWDAFLAGGHDEAHGNRSLWGGAVRQELDFIRSPYGAGRHLRREGFDRMLQRAVEAAGGRLVERARVSSMRRERGSWLLALASGERRWEIRAGFAIDATGRARAVARAQGARRCVHDRLIGIVGVFDPAPGAADVDSFTTVEAEQDGWWYAAPIPDGRLVAGFMTDADLATESGMRDPGRWLEALGRTELLREKVMRHGYRIRGPLRTVSADSSCLDTPAGEAWCATGDAASAYDPLSSQGIVSALTGGVQAGLALGRASNGGLAEYGDRMRDAYARYRAQWMAYYAIEGRWPDSPFWRRRHEALERLLRAG